MTFLLVNFAAKNAMFNLNENNRFVMAQHPSDMRIGVNRMCGQVRAVGLDPTNGDVYIFVGSSRKIMKLLHWERRGFAMYYKRLEQGRFHPRIFLRQGIGVRAKYHYFGLEERTTTLMPEGVDADQYDIIGKDVTRIPHREPAKVWVEVIERPILRAKSDKALPNPRICQAKAPQSIIGGNHIGADMLAQIVIDKYRYHLPEYRQVKQYADLGVKLPASTINGWVHAVASKLEPLYEAQRREVLGNDYLQIDEVPWRIADSPGKSRKGYAWQFLDNRPQSHGLYFLYMNGSRAGTVPRAELRDFRGAIQTDGYGVYDYFESQENVALLGCMAHVRRKFTDAQASHPQLAAQAVKWIELLYTLEANLRDEGAGYERIAAERQAKALPIMDAMEQWMETVHTQCTPADPMGKALDYAYKQWPKLRRYALDGRYRIDNNPVERAQRPSVIGRKNYLFSKSDSGAVDNAIFYSLIESCEIVGIEPLRWLTDVPDSLRDDTPPDQVRQMLPYYYKKSQG
ncbi:MAG: IS66 family transposase [Bacteroidales bacterium]|nr:IS66 family transposase [Bacteroidales bacterium]